MARIDLDPWFCKVALSNGFYGVDSPQTAQVETLKSQRSQHGTSCCWFLFSEEKLVFLPCWEAFSNTDDDLSLPRACWTFFLSRLFSQKRKKRKTPLITEPVFYKR